MTSPRIALVSTKPARALDEDLPPLVDALREAGAAVDIVDWDDETIDLAGFNVAVLRSTWDYTDRPAEFLAWTEHAPAQTRLLNPPEVVRWNTDKHYLAELARAGIATVPSAFVEPDADAAAALDAFFESDCSNAAEFVVKPCVGAGSRDAQRHGRDERDAAIAHVERLQRAQRSVLLQPYLARVDDTGETALIFFDSVFSHAIRKGALLRRGDAPTRALFAREVIAPRTPGTAEQDLAQRAIAALPFATPLYARVDLIQSDDGAPRLLELELTEPSLFFAHAQGSADRFARAILLRAEDNAPG